MTQNKLPFHASNSFQTILAEPSPKDRTVIDGEWIFLSQKNGYNSNTRTISNDLCEQVYQTCNNIKIALEGAGAGFEDIVRIRYYISDIDDFEKVRMALVEYFGKVRLSATAIIKQMSNPEMKIEMEVTAKVSRWSMKTA